MSEIFIDFETYYDSEYSLSKMTTAEYINDPRFEIVMLCYKTAHAPVQFIDGRDRSQMTLLINALPWDQLTLVAHNALFDAAILEWKFGVKARKYFCTMMGSRPNYFHRTGSMALGKLADHLALGVKGHAAQNMKGIRRAVMRPSDVMAYRAYCEQDVILTQKLYNHIAPGLPLSERELIDSTIRKYVRPQFAIDYQVLKTRLGEIEEDKATALLTSGVTDPKELRSNPKFAEALTALGVDPPRKISLTTGKETWAFAKSDPGMQELLDSDDPQIAALTSARLQLKSTIEQSRLERFMRQPPLLPVPLLYYGAHTGRFSGLDKLNMQNLPSRGGPQVQALRRALTAPPGYKVVAADLSQIEARVLVTIANHEEMRAAFASGQDVYKLVAAKIYGIAVADVSKAQRFIGKQCVLALNYGMGVDKFMDTMRIAKNPITHRAAKEIVNTYRNSNPQVPQLWRTAETMLQYMAGGTLFSYGPLMTEGQKLRLPNGMAIHYPGLESIGGNYQYYPAARRGGGTDARYIYGGKLVENFTQALARIVVTEMELRLKKHGIHAALQVHDELVFVVPEGNVHKFKKAITMVMRQPPAWMPDLPVDCEVGVGDNYGDCK